MNWFDSFKKFIKGFVRFNKILFFKFGFFKFFIVLQNQIDLFKFCGLRVNEITEIYDSISKRLHNYIINYLKDLIKEGKLRELSKLAVITIVDDLIEYIKTNGFIFDFDKFKCSLNITPMEVRYIQYFYKDALNFLENILLNELYMMASPEGL